MLGKPSYLQSQNNTLRPRSSVFNRQTDGLTQSERELKPFVDVAKTQYDDEKERKNVLEFVLDVLQTPNYMSANFFDAMYDGIRANKPMSQTIGDAVQGLWKGLTWQDTRTFSDVIEGNVGEGSSWTKPILGEGHEGKFLLGATPSDVVGLGLDIFLDPTTYMTFGASSGARAAAKKFAEDSVATTISRLSAKELAEVAGREVSEKAINKIASKSKNFSDDIVKYLQKNSDTFSKWMNDVYKQAERTALRNPSDVIQKGLQEQLNTIIEKTPEELRGGFSSLAKSIDRGYQGAGEYGLRWFGQNVLTGQRQDSPIAKSMDYIFDALRESKTGQRFSDAWWSIMNRGPVGKLRKTFGIRNPYQQLLNMKERNATALMESTTSKLVDEAGTYIRELGEDLQTMALKVRGVAEQSMKAVGEEAPLKLTVKDILQNKGLYVSEGIDKISDENAKKIAGFWDNMDKVFKQMRDREMSLVDQGYLKDFGEILNYIPKKQQGYGMLRPTKNLASEAQGFTQQTVYTTEESIRQGIEKLKMIYGDTLEKTAAQRGITVDALADQIVRETGYGSPISTNLADMIEHRIIAHSRAVQRGELIKQFRPFGINLKSLDVDTQEAVQAITREMANLDEIGLVPVKDPAFDGMVFDKEVADILNKIYSVTNSDDSIKWFQSLARNYTNWWKTVVTSTPGFHMRNLMSNNITGFLRHGPGWLDPNKTIDGTIATYYALNPSKFREAVKQTFEVSDGFINQRLAKQYGDFTLKELAEYAREKGVISSFSYQGQLKKSLGKIPTSKRINPLNEDFQLFRASKNVGNYVENSARMQSFLMSYEEAMGSMAGQNIGKSFNVRAAENELSLVFATQDAKRWFIDYGDLTEAEKKIASIVPFYTWIRKNLANQINGMVMMPEMYRLIPKLQTAVTQDEGFDYELQPDWMRKMGMFPVGEDQETGQRIMWYPNIPMTDIAKIPLTFAGDIRNMFSPKFQLGELKDEFFSSAHPTVKSLIEKAMGYNTFKRRAFIEGGVKAPGLLQYFTNSPQMIGVLDGIARSIGFEDGIRINEQKGRVEMDEGMERLLVSNLPIIRTLEEWLDTTEYIPVIGAAIENATGRKDDYEGMEDFFHTLSYFGGLKFKTFDEEYYKQQRAKEIESQAEKMRKEYRKTLPGYQQRSTKYWEDQEKRRRRLGLYGP